MLKNKNMEGGGKTTYPICIIIPYMRAIVYNAVEFFISGTKVKIVLFQTNETVAIIKLFINVMNIRFCFDKIKQTSKFIDSYILNDFHYFDS